MAAVHDRQSQLPVVLQEDSTRTAYQPQLKILKRPTGTEGQTNGEMDRNSKQTVVNKH